MQAIYRQQKRKYVSSLHSSPEKRVDARHHYLMLKEMPYRDSNGRALTMFRFSPLQIQHLHPPHSRPLQRKSRHSSHSSLFLSSPALQHSPSKLPDTRLSRRRGRKLDFLISCCEESLSSSPERSHRGKRRESMPSRV